MSTPPPPTSDGIGSQTVVRDLMLRQGNEGSFSGENKEPEGKGI